MLNPFAWVVHRIREIVSWGMDLVSLESYYRFKVKFWKYFYKIIVPSIIGAALGNALYVVLGWLLRWQYMPFIGFAIWLAILIFLILNGCLRGEDRQDDFYADR